MSESPNGKLQPLMEGSFVRDFDARSALLFDDESKKLRMLSCEKEEEDAQNFATFLHHH